MGYFSEIIRRRRIAAMGRGRKTEFTPLQDVRTAIIIADPKTLESVVPAIRKKLPRAAVTTVITDTSVRRKNAADTGEGSVLIFKDDLFLAGTLKKEAAGGWLYDGQDLLVNTLPSFTYPAEFIVRCSNARFKCGTGTGDNEALDLGIVVKEDTSAEEAAAFLMTALGNMGRQL